jgi:hypothetical protein
MRASPLKVIIFSIKLIGYFDESKFVETAEITAIRKSLFTLDFSQCMLNVLFSLLHGDSRNPMKHSSFLIMVIKVMTYQLQAPGEDNNFKRNARKQGLLKNLIKLYKEILVANL